MPVDGKVGRILVKIGTAGTSDDWVILGDTVAEAVYNALSADLQALFEAVTGGTDKKACGLLSGAAAGEPGRLRA